MKIFVACEYSGRVRDAFIKRGHDAISCDFLPSESDKGPHIIGDVLEIMDDWGGQLGWKPDLMIAHPPCTYIANSGVSWLYRQEGRWEKMVEGAKFFKRFLDADVEKICVENPTMHGHALKIVQSNYTQAVQPWMFGEDASKRTCLWLKGLPELKSTNPLIKKRYANQTPSGQNKLGPSEDRAKIRSLTYQGIADAMAAQWG